MYCCPSPTIWPHDGVGGLMPTPMKRERGLGEDRLRDAEGDRDDDRRERVGQDVAHEQAAEAGAERPGAVDELLLLDREHLRRASGGAMPTQPVSPIAMKMFVSPAPSIDMTRITNKQARERVHDVDEAREEHVDPAAERSPTGRPIGTPIRTTITWAPSPTSIDTRAP